MTVVMKSVSEDAIPEAVNSPVPGQQHRRGSERDFALSLRSASRTRIDVDPRGRLGVGGFGQERRRLPLSDTTPPALRVSGNMLGATGATVPGA